MGIMSSQYCMPIDESLAEIRSKRLELENKESASASASMNKEIVIANLPHSFKDISDDFTMIVDYNDPQVTKQLTMLVNKMTTEKQVEVDRHHNEVNTLNISIINNSTENQFGPDTCDSENSTMLSEKFGLHPLLLQSPNAQ